MSKALLFVLGWAVLLAGCNGRSPTGPESGRVNAQVTDTSGPNTANGTLTGNVFASVWDGSRWIDLGSPNGITIPLQVVGRMTTVHGEQSVPPGSYTRVRLVFEGALARLPSGWTVGGSPLAADVVLTVGGPNQRVEVVTSVSPFSISADTSTRRSIIFDLRSQQWLTTTAVQNRRVEASALQDAISVGVRVDSP